MTGTKTYYTLGILFIIMMVGGITYIQFDDDAQMRIDNDKAVFYVKELGWVVSALQEDRLFEGTSIINRVKSTIERKNYTENNLRVEYRSTGYKNGEQIVHTWKFDPLSENIEDFPIYEEICVYNAKDKFYRYSLKQLYEPGPKRKLVDETSASFGRNMKVTFQTGYNWGWVGWPYGSNSFALQYKIDSDSECFNIRMFDPPSWNATGTPVVNQPSIQPNSSVVYDSILNCSVYSNFTENVLGESYNATFAFFKNAILQTDYTNVRGPNTSSPWTVYSGENVTEVLVKDDIWQCKVKYFTDSGLFSSIYESEAVTVQNSAPNVTLTNPDAGESASISPGHPINLTWEILDGDDDTSFSYVYGKITEWCYQETANVSTVCGGLNTGEYSLNGTWNYTDKFYDGNWTTYSEPYGSSSYWLFMNYTKPDSAKSTSIWQVKDANYHNLSISSTCFSQNTTQFGVQAKLCGGNPCIVYYCYNSTNWISLYQANNQGWFSEEAMYWDLAEYDLLINGTSLTSYNWSNATDESALYWWYIITNDGTINTTSETRNFTVTFINWSIEYSPGIGSFQILPTASNGTFAPTNQSGTYGEFNVTNYGNESINLSVNLSVGLPRGISLGFGELDNAWCYQESANISTSCGGLSTGWYSIINSWTSPSNLYDGNWSTSSMFNSSAGDGTSIMYIKYYKPSNVLSSSLWRIKDSYGEENLTIPETCWTQDPLFFGIHSANYSSNYLELIMWSCYDGTSWERLREKIIYTRRDSHDPLIYEEAIWWDIGFPDDVSNWTELVSDSYTERAYDYNKFNDSETSQFRSFNDTAANESYYTQPVYNRTTATGVIVVRNVVNSSYNDVANLKFYGNETLLLNFVPTTLNATGKTNLSITDQVNYSICGFMDYDYINITNSSLIICEYDGNTTSGWATMSAANRFDIDSLSTISGDEKGMSGGAGGAKGLLSSLYSGYGGLGGLSDWSTSCGGSTGTRSGPANVGATRYWAMAGGGGGGSGGHVTSSNGATGGTSGWLAGGPGGLGGCEVSNESILNSRPMMGAGGGGGAGGGCGNDGWYCGTAGTDGSTGSNGGGGLKIITNQLYFFGNITVNGGDGGAGGKGGLYPTIYAGGTGGGGGGAQGGEIILQSTAFINITGAYFESKGGSGGSGAGGHYPGATGSAGEGGRIKIFYVTGPINFTYNVSSEGTVYNQTNETIETYINQIDFSSELNTFLSTCDDWKEGSSKCLFPFRLEGIEVNTTLQNMLINQSGVTGTTNKTFIIEVPANTTLYLSAKAVYQNPVLGALFDILWIAEEE